MTPKSIVTADVDASDNALYVQDQWRPNARMTINAGLRLDWVQSEDRQAGIQTQDSLEVGPRFGATYSLTSDHRNILRASFGRVGELVQAGRVAVLTSSNAGRTDTYDNDLDGVFETVQITPAPRRPGAIACSIRMCTSHTSTSGRSGSAVSSRASSPSMPDSSSATTRIVRRRSRSTGSTMASSSAATATKASTRSCSITNDEWNWYDYTSFEFLLTKRAASVQMIGSYVRAWRKIDGDWQPNDPASFIQPDAFANDKCIGIPRTAPSNSLSGTADTFGCTGWQDHTGRLALTWTAPWA